LSDSPGEEDDENDEETESSEDMGSHSTRHSHEVCASGGKRLGSGVVWVGDDVGLFLLVSEINVTKANRDLLERGEGGCHRVTYSSACLEH
jgi:hypothetical protein